MAKIIAVANQKGGTGKTTTSINLGAALADLGKFCLLLDFDPQANATSGLGIKVEENTRSIYDVLVKGGTSRDIIKKTSHRDLHLLPAHPALSGANVDLVNMPKREFRLQEVLLEIRNDYDYILIDCPPSLGLLTVNAFVAADRVLIPVQTEYYAIEGLSQLLHTIGLIKRNLKPDIDIMGAVMTMYDKRVRLSREVVWEVRKNFPYRVFDSLIPRNIRLAEAPSFGKTIFENANFSKGAAAYRRLAKEVIDCE